MLAAQTVETMEAERMVAAQTVEVTLDRRDRDGETCPALGIQEYFPAWMGRVGERWPGELSSKRDEKFPWSPISTWAVSTGKRLNSPREIGFQTGPEGAADERLAEPDCF